jgi:hypothetical protein
VTLIQNWTVESDDSENAAPEEDKIIKDDQSSGPIEQVKSKDIPSSESEKVLKRGVTRNRRRETLGKTTTNKQVPVNPEINQLWNVRKHLSWKFLNCNRRFKWNQLLKNKNCLDLT